MSRILPGILAMAIVVVASNILVQHLLGDWLTWGALTYPVAFLVTDIMNRIYGPQAARKVVFAGFLTGVLCSVVAAGLDKTTLRIAIASGAAFLSAQLLDIAIFNRLRQRNWWLPPLAATVAGSILDTVIFFGIAFSAAFAFIGPDDAFALESAPLLGVLPFEAARWISWALGDLSVKLLIAVFALIPYRLIAARWSQPAMAAN